MFDRRALLLGLLSCPICAAVARADEGAAWSYEGDTGPTKWGGLDPSFKTCATGAEQSPIDLTGAMKADLGSLKLSWKPEAYPIVNNGHTIQANVAPGSSMSVGGRTYQLQQFHFHTPSEHALNGRQFAMEAHFVHGDANGRYAVVGAFMQAGAKNAAFAAVMAAAPKTDGQQSLKRPIDPRQLVPSKSHFYRYAGSLTTPPCGEVVDWNVYETPVDVAETDIMAFKAIFPMNARPLQPLNRRFLLIGG